MTAKFHPLWLAAIITMVFITGCSFRKIPQPPQTPVPTEMTGLGENSTKEPDKTEPVPSPTVSEPTLAPYTTYENTQYGLRFETPIGFQHFDPAAFWKLQEGVLWSAGFSAPNDLAPLEYQAPLGVTVYANPENLPLSLWFEKHSGHPTADPNSQIYFFDPLPGEVMMLNGNPSMHYVRARTPQREEMLISRFGIVIGVHFASGLEYDYQPAYEFILETLVLFELPAQPSPTPEAPVICLDDQAVANPVLPRPHPLDVWYLSDGDIWQWSDGGVPPQKISNTHDVRDFWFSSDGSLAILQRWLDEQRVELWVVNRAGTELRSLLLADQVRSYATDSTVWQVLPQVVGWSSDGRQPIIEIYGVYEGIGGCCTIYGLWQVDLDNGELTRTELPAVDKPGIHSPDGKKVALVTESSLSIADDVGNILYRDVLTYPVILGHEGGWYYYPLVTWLQDSRALSVLVYPEKLFGSEMGLFTTWRVPADGRPAEKLHDFEGFALSASFSPDGSSLVYWREDPPMSNRRDLHLASADGQVDLVYASGKQLDLIAWSPDGFHFVYGSIEWGEDSAQGEAWIGSLCGTRMPLVDSSSLPVQDVMWLDSEWFLFTVWVDFDVRELRLGLLGKDSALIGKLVGPGSMFKVK